MSGSDENQLVSIPRTGTGIVPTGGKRRLTPKPAATTTDALVSIITATYNAAAYLPNLAASLQALNYRNFEWIVVDANSTDETINLLNHYDELIDYWISEPDQGIYDAWNKGLQAAQGEWVCFMGADDQITPDSLTAMLAIAAASAKPLDFISGRVAMYRGTKLLRTIGKPWSWRQFQTYMCVAHTGALHRLGYFKQYGSFDNSFKICGDYEILLRSHANLKAGFTPSVVASMQVGGQSNHNPAVFAEVLRARLLHNLTTPFAGQLNAIWAKTRWHIRKLIGIV
ncbi:glycosyltransferase [Methylomonas paludis]|uniref:Glycosyltransferase n=1 Tax=Methylomonas paludis TaxID=1173101 RepID=A0A975R9C6_9GAMM|nr:glycosyltransferase family 2 protein [Methylomonas paludis]QWF70937.1 glycosyltransferase [Methylomonas paludis]